jgi:hypothetical protein
MYIILFSCWLTQRAISNKTFSVWQKHHQKCPTWHHPVCLVVDHHYLYVKWECCE